MSAALKSQTAIQLAPATPVIGAEVTGIDLRQPLTPAEVAELQQALNDWKVLVFRDQHISDEDQLRFGRYLGPLTPAHPIAEGLPEHPEIWERKASEYVERHRKDLNIPTAQPPRDYNGWHIDITFVANPNSYSILRGVEIPPYGGDTLFTNLQAAYENLSPPIQALADGLQYVHGASAYDMAGPPRRDGSKPGPFVSVHPLVRIHPKTGKKSLFVSPGGRSGHIVGLKQRESEAILDLVRAESIRPEYGFRVHWAPGTMVIWDNQATAHAGPIDYAHFTGKRIVRRITVAGEIPQGPDGFRSRPLEGELFGVIG